MENKAVINSEYPLNDNKHEDFFIEKVTKSKSGGWEITFDKCCCFFCPDSSPIIPQKGMTVRFYPHGLGSIVRGLFIDGKKVFYRTESEQQSQNELEIADSNIKKRKKFQENKEKYFTRIKALPECFQKRIAKFQNANSDYDWEFGDYELYCCEQAVVIADTLKTSDAIQRFSKQDWKEQKLNVPTLDDGHSGNTFGFAVRLAYWYIANPSNVIAEHGALTPLIGCKEYGCPHKK